MATQENLNKFKIGQCHNVGNCTHIGEKQAIPSDIANSGGFKCKYCGAPLKEIEKSKSFWEKYGKVIIIAAAILILAGVGYFISTLTSGGTKSEKSDKSKDTTIVEKKEKPVNIPGSQGGNLITSLAIIDAKDFNLKKGATKQLSYQAVPKQNSETPIWESSDPSVVSVDTNGMATAIKKGSAQIIVKTHNVTSDPLTITVTEDTPIQEPPTPQQLPYGRYTGDRNTQGQPHGFGDVVFTKSKMVTSGTYAEPGYKIRNARFVNGKLQSGTLYDADGNKVCFIDANNNL